MDVPATIRRLRLARGLTQRDLGERVGVGPQYLYQVESGFRRPSLAALERLAVVLSVSLPELFTDTQVTA